ncbi:hypothetical protein VTO73DRAFT_5785 [Trametes versicolor]
MLAHSFVSLAGGILSLISSASFVSAQLPLKSGVEFIGRSPTSDNVGVFTPDDYRYFTTVNLGGLNLTLYVDTGSFDLVVYPRGRNIKLTNSTNLHVNEIYGIGEAEGDIQFADLRMGDITISSQAFLLATETQNFAAYEDGILGLGFNGYSTVYNTLARTYGAEFAAQTGNTPVTALFAQQPSLARTVDMQLSREDELRDITHGTFLVGEHDANFQDVTSAPQLPVVSPGNRWAVVMDAMNINGAPFTFNKSSVPGTPDGKVVALLDTGYSFPPLPPAAVDAIYSSIPGAVRDPSLGFPWVVPCNASLKLSFVFAGQEFFVHPLDLTYVATDVVGTSGNRVNAAVCVNTFRYNTLNPAEFSGNDLNVGAPFMRNVYASFTYGSGTESAGSFVQMVSTTPDFDTALQEFQTQRAATLAKFPPVLDPASLNITSGPSAQSAALSPSTAQTPTQFSSAVTVQGATLSLSAGTASRGTPTVTASAPQNTTAGSSAQEPSGALGRGIWGGKLLGIVALLSSVLLVL